MDTRPPLFLASRSPRRQELLGAILRHFRVFVPKQEELKAPKSISFSFAQKMVREIAEAKAIAALAEYKGSKKQGCIFLSADTLVFCGNRVLGKPHSPAEAKKMLRLLSGKKHKVITAVSVLSATRDKAKIKSIALTTEVSFYPLSSDFIDWYVATKEPLDKAGAYGAQGKGAAMIRSFKGSYSNVVGLPVAETLALLSQVSGRPWRLWC